MKPWFVQEADIIKFPTPKAKVVDMPNVQSYPDFLTGVKDLHNRKAQGEISQDSHDRLYSDLINRFMKKESFETPWFLREAKISAEEEKIKNTITKLIKNIKGVKEITGTGSQLSIMIDVPPKTKARAYRIEFMKNIANLLQTKHKIDAQYDPRRTSASTSGFVSVGGTNLKYYVRDGKKQGDERAGVANEVNLVKLIKDQIDKYGDIDVTFRDDRGITLTVKKATNVAGTGTDTKGRKKADLIITNGVDTIPISLKKKNAGFYESADSLFGARARKVIDILLKKGTLKLGKKMTNDGTPQTITVRGETKPVYKMSSEIVVEPTTQDAVDVMFGGDLNPKGGIVIQDFQAHHFIMKDGQIFVDCYAVIKSLNDVPEAHLMYWLILNKPRNATKIGIAGIGAAAVTMTRAFGSKLTKNPIFVNQEGNPIKPPKPRDPTV